MQLLVGRLWTPHPGDIHVVSRAWPRPELMDLARRLGVSQRALFMALTAVVVAGAGHGARRRISATYSTLDPGGPRNRDPFIRMRMRFATLDDAADFAALVRAVDRRLAEVDARPDGLGPELAAVVPGLHRRLAARLPWLYSPKVFAFMPYDFIFALLPPHRLAGPLAAGLLEPVYAAATLPGVVGCVVVPGRRMVSFNFALEQHRMDDVERLDRVLHEQGIGTSVLDATTVSPG
jgi:hypothetical protein